MIKDGYKFAAAPLLTGIVALVFHWNWAGGVLIFLGVFVLFFFRDPERKPPTDPQTIVSPADGRVMEIGVVRPTVLRPALARLERAISRLGEATS